MKIKKSVLMLLSAALIVSMLPTSAFASKNSAYQINSLDSLKAELKKTVQKVDYCEVQESLVEKTNPIVINEFVEEKTLIAQEKLKDIDPDNLMKQDEDGVFRGQTEIDLGDGCSALVEFEDGIDDAATLQEDSPVKASVSRAVNGETMWKDYGNRYFTASTSILSGIGTCKISLENHYTLSANGIDERYGDAYESAGFNVGITGTVGHGDVIISDASARTPGASEVNMYVRFSWQYDGQGIATAQGNTKLSTTVGCVDIDKTKKQIKVKHSWSSI